MVQVDKQENTEVLRDTVAYLEKKGFENIKADSYLFFNIFDFKKDHNRS